MSQDATEQLIRRFFMEYGKGDPAGLGSLLSSDASWTVVGSGLPRAGTHKTRDRILNDFLLPIRAMFDPNEFHVTLDTLVWRDNIAMAESRTSARMRNGNLYENRYCWVFEIASEHILHVREYFDTLHTASMVMRRARGRPVQGRV